MSKSPPAQPRHPNGQYKGKPPAQAPAKAPINPSTGQPLPPRGVPYRMPEKDLPPWKKG